MSYNTDRRKRCARRILDAHACCPQCVQRTCLADLTAWSRTAHRTRPGASWARRAGKVFERRSDALGLRRWPGTPARRHLRGRRAGSEMFPPIDTIRQSRLAALALRSGWFGLAACVPICCRCRRDFGFTETKLGILPAMISPYVLQKIGASAARELFLTGMRFDATRAQTIGLVHAIVAAAALDDAVESFVREALSASPTAVARAKALIPNVLGRSPADVIDITADAIATQRVSPEGQEGLKAFLEKRQPSWHVPTP